MVATYVAVAAQDTPRQAHNRQTGIDKRQLSVARRSEYGSHIIGAAESPSDAGAEPAKVPAPEFTGIGSQRVPRRPGQLPRSEEHRPRLATT